MYGFNEYEFVQEVSSIIWSFLKDNGGYSNGYFTYVTGSVRPRTHSHLDWKTPRQLDMTIREVETLGAKLYDEILAVMDRYAMSTNDCLVISHIEESGCSRMRLTIEHSYMFEYGVMQ